LNRSRGYLRNRQGTLRVLRLSLFKGRRSWLSLGVFVLLAEATKLGTNLVGSDVANSVAWHRHRRLRLVRIRGRRHQRHVAEEDPARRTPALGRAACRVAP